jgi:hypothetical protein
MKGGENCMPNYNAGDNPGSFKNRDREEVRRLARQGGKAKGKNK